MRRFTPSFVLRTKTRTGLIAALLLAVVAPLAWLAMPVPDAEAQGSGRLVGNWVQNRNGYFELDKDEQGFGQVFTTGSSRGAYYLDSVVLRIEQGHESRYIDLEGAIYTVESDGSRGDRLFGLLRPDKYINHANFRLEAGSGTLLLPDTSYMMVIRCNEGCANDNYLQFAKTASEDEDADSLENWSIADNLVLASEGWEPGNIGSTSDSNALVMRVVGRFASKPYIKEDGVSVASTPATGNTYGAGETISFSVQFNDKVEVDTTNGVPQITVHIGGAVAPVREQAVDYVGGSGSSTLVFEYVAQSGDEDTNGIRVYAQSVDLNGATIKHISNRRDAFLDFEGVENGDALSGHRIDGSVATPVVTLTALSLSGVIISPNFSSEMTDYVALVAEDFDVTTVAATPETDGSATIKPADADANTDGHQVALDDGPNEITIAVTKAGHIPNTYTVMVTRDPRELATITGFSVTTRPLQGPVYMEGETITIEVAFDNAVDVDTANGRPALTVDFRVHLNDGNFTRRVRDFNYVRGSGSDTLAFEHIVKSNDKGYGRFSQIDAMRIQENRLVLNGGTIRHAENGRDADLSFPEQIFDTHKIHGLQTRSIAKLSALAVSGVDLDPAFDADQIIYTGTIVNPGAVAAVTVTATPEGTASAAIVPADSDTGADGHQVELVEGINEITVTTTESGRGHRNYNLTVARIRVPEITGLAVVSDPGSDATYATGDAIDVEVTFDIEVEVDTASGTPSLALSIGSATRSASYASTAADGRVLTFAYTVASGDSDQDGVSIAADALALNGGTIKKQDSDVDAVLDHSAISDRTGHIVNKIPKIVADGLSVTSTPLAASGTYGVGETIQISVTFDSDVVVDTAGGTPYLNLTVGDSNNGFRTRSMNYAGGSGTPTLAFEYVVKPADRDNNGFNVGKNQLRLNGGTIRHATTGHDANLNHARPDWTGGSLLRKVDGRIQPPKAELTALSLSGVVLTPAFVGTTTGYTATVPISLAETTVTATPETGATVDIQPADADANAAGHQVALAEGDTTITITVTKSGETTVTYTATITRSATPVITGLSVASDPGSDGTYATGDAIDVEVTFDMEVAVHTANGTPTLSLTIGDNTRDASYSSTAAGNLALTFSYTVTSDDSDQDGISIAADSLTLNGGAIKKLNSDVDAALAHDALTNQSGHEVNKIPKIVTGGLAITSTPVAAAGTYGLGETIRISVTFDSDVVVDTTGGAPFLNLSAGDPRNGFRTRRMNYTSGSDTATLLFEYVVVAADRDNNGFIVEANELRLGGGTIRHATTGRDADLDHVKPTWPNGSTTRKIDGRLLPPKAELTALSFSGVALSPAFTADTTTYTATVSGSVEETTITAAPETGAVASIVPEDADGNATGHQVELAEGDTVITITITKSGETTTTYTVTITRSLEPMITAVTVASHPGSDNTYATGDAIDVEVTFDIEVAVDTTNGTPSLALTIGDDTRDAAYSSTAAGDVVLTFSYSVASDDSDQDGISIAANALARNGGAIKKLNSDVDADLEHDALPNQSGHVVNKVPKIVPGGLSVTSTPVAAAGTYGLGEAIRVSMGFDSDVVVDTTNGTPYLTLTTGDSDNGFRDRRMNYAGGSGTDTLTFEYLVKAVDRDDNGFKVNRNALKRNGGIIKHATTGKEASVRHGRANWPDGDLYLKIDGRLLPPKAELTALSFSGVTLSPAFAADTTTYTATVSGSVEETTITAAPETGAVASIVPEDADGNATGHQVELAEGNTVITITITKSGESTTTYTVTITRSLEPEITGMAVVSDPGSDGTYATGDAIDVEVTFDTEVAVDTTSGTPSLALTIGDATRDAAYSSTAAGNRVLTFSYTVISDDSDQNGISIAADSLALNGGTIKKLNSDVNADLEHDALPNQSGHVVNKIPKIVPGGLSVTSTPLAAAGTYGQGETIQISVQFDSDVVVDTTGGTPYLNLTTGDSNNGFRTRRMGYADGSGTDTLTFEYVVVAADRDNNGFRVTRDELKRNGGTIKHATTGKEASVRHGRTNWPDGNLYLKIDGRIAPTLSTLANLSLSGITFSPAFAGGTTEYEATVASTLTETTVSATVDMDATVVMLPPDSDGNTAGHQVGLSVGANEITVTVDSDTTLPQTYTVSVTRRAGPPTITGLSITSEPDIGVGTYGPGETISFKATFDTEVEVDTSGGTPRLKMRIGDSANGFRSEYLDYAEGSGATVLEFEYVVQASDRDNNGIFVEANAIQLNGGAIRDATTGEDADLRHVKPGQNGGFPEHKVDGSLIPTTPIPTNLTATTGNQKVTLAWDTPDADDDIDRHEYRYKTGADDYPATWTEIADSAPEEDNEDGVTISGLTNGVTYTFQVRAVGSLGIGQPSNEASAVPGQGQGICDRTREVQVAIMNRISGVSECSDVTTTHLAAITSVLVYGVSAGLKAGDFAGLSAVTLIIISDSTQLTELPDGIFDGLSSVSQITLRRTQIAQLQADTFDGLTTLRYVQLEENLLTALPDDIFNPVPDLTALEMGKNQIAELPDGVFDSLTSLTTLWLNDNRITELPDGIFDEISAVTDLRLDGNQLPEIPEGALDSMTELLDLRLDRNQLTALPDGIFTGKGSLAGLQLQDNSITPLPIPVSLAQTGSLEFKAVMPTGAPFDVTLPVDVTYGAITGGASTVAIAIGETDSDPVAVTRAADAQSSVQADVGASPDLPEDHSGYILSKSADLPLTVTRGGVSGVAITSDPGIHGTYATGDTIQVDVNFDVPVAVDTTGGAPSLALTIGTASRSASYSSIDATKMVLTFEYTVVSGDSDQNGVSVIANALALNGGAITLEGATTDALIDHAALGDQGGHLVNKVPMIVSNGIYITSTPQSAADTYGATETITFAVTFDSDVVVDTDGGAPRLKVRFQSSGDTAQDKNFTYVRGSGSGTLEFEYAVQEGDMDDDGLSVLANQLSRRGATIRHVSTEKDADITYSPIGPGGSFPGHTVDGSIASTLVKLCGARLDAQKEYFDEAQLRLCWDLGVAIPTGRDVVIELRKKEYWDSDSTYSQWTEVARGDNYTRCSSNPGTCLRHTLLDLMRGGTEFYQMRIREGSTVVATSGPVIGQAPNYDDSALNAWFGGCFQLGGFVNCGIPTGDFWVDLEFTDPETTNLTTERVQGFHTSDLVVTNGSVTSIAPIKGGQYQVVIQPTTLGEPVTIHLPANRVKGVGEGVSAIGGNNFTRDNTATDTVTIQTAVP